MSTTIIYIGLAVCLAIICVALMLGGEIRRVGVRQRGATVTNPGVLRVRGGRGNPSQVSPGARKSVKNGKRTTT